MTLAELVSRRLLAAGFHYDDPALVAIRRHNAAAYAMRDVRKLRTGFSDPLADPAPGRPRWAVLQAGSNIAKPGT